MGGYTKNIAVIKGLKDGFSADGGKLSGLVKAEKYGANLKVEVSLINFAPLTEGKYVAAISDGVNTEIIENCAFEGQSAVDTSLGFAAVICYVQGGVSLIASAICGNFHGEAFGLKGIIEHSENVKKVSPEKDEALSKRDEKVDDEGSKKIQSEYEDEAIAEVNYYEFAETDEGCVAVCENPQKEKDGVGLCEDEANFSPVQKEPLNVNPSEKEDPSEAGGGLARGNFYERMKKEIDGLFSSYPPEESLIAAIEQSRWVKISYGGDNFYVFGVIYDSGIPRYICYGVPAEEDGATPESMRGIASFLPVKSQHGCGFWIMYQDAETGASIKVSAE